VGKQGIYLTKDRPVNEKEIARRIVAAADKREGNIFVRDIDQADINFGLERGWLEAVGIGHSILTERGRLAAT
jgi:hypothetical protein